MNKSRRKLLRNSLGLATGASVLAPVSSAQDSKLNRFLNKNRSRASKGRINQSIVSWCFAKYWSTEKMCQVAKDLGCKSLELISPDEFPIMGKHGLTCAITPIDMGGPPFIQGWNNPKYHAKVGAATRKAIDAASEFGSPNVIAFNGYAEDVSLEKGAANCVEGLKGIIGYAEEKNVTLCLEMLNTRDDSDPNKGHPGYQGDHIDYCLDIVKKVGSPNMKLLFDIYHVQIMDGDVIRRVHECGEHIGHVHTAGNPGRGELDDDQEINYPPIMKALLEVGYKGFVGQEFIPTRDPLQGLTEAVQLCDV